MTESRHTDGMQLKWTVEGKSAVLNLSPGQLEDWDNGEGMAEGIVEDFIAKGVLVYYGLLQEKSRTQTEEG